MCDRAGSAAAQAAPPRRTEAQARERAETNRRERERKRFFSNYGECFAGKVKVETPEELAADDPKLNELIARV